MSDYLMLKAEKTKCPGCFLPVTLIQKEDFIGPMFYICFTCERVFEIGIGEITCRNAKSVEHK